MLRQLLVCGGCSKGKEREGKRSRGCQPSPHKARWGVRQARGTYGCRPLTQPGECILPSEGNSEYCCTGSQLSKTAIYGFPLGQTSTTGHTGEKKPTWDVSKPTRAVNDFLFIMNRARNDQKVIFFP